MTTANPWEALKRLSDAADEINGMIDSRIDEERRTYPDGPNPESEFAVSFTWAEISTFNSAIYEAQQALRNQPTMRSHGWLGPPALHDKANPPAGDCP